MYLGILHHTKCWMVYEIVSVEYHSVSVARRTLCYQFPNKLIVHDGNLFIKYFHLPTISKSLSLLTSRSSDMKNSSKCCRDEKPKMLILEEL